MAALPLGLLLLLAAARQARAVPAASSAASSEAFDSVLGNTASCHRACQLTYSLHTYPKVRAGPAVRRLRGAGRPRGAASGGGGAVLPVEGV